MSDKTTTETKKNGADKPAILPLDTRFQIAVDVFAKMHRGFDSDEDSNARHALKAADAFIAQYQKSR